MAVLEQKIKSTHINSETDPFLQKARNVIKNSIRSAVCIDDEYESAYSSSHNSSKFKESQSLYESFRKDGDCDLDIYKYVNKDSWNKDFVLNNKDLVVLDWELDPNNRDCPHAPAIEIMDRIISESKIPFVCIYTSKENLDEIADELLINFNIFSEKETRTNLFKIYNDMLKEMDPDSNMSITEFCNDNQSFILDELRNPQKKDTLFLEKFSIFFEFEDTLTQIPSQITKPLGKYQKKFNDIYTCLLTLLATSSNTDREPSHFQKTSFSNEKIFKIKKTTILIFKKNTSETNSDQEVNVNELFESFTDALINKPHNFLDLLSLEFKDQMREMFSQIGMNFTGINENAFLYHLEKLTSNCFEENSIYEFISKTWLADFTARTLEGKSKIIPFSKEIYAKSEEHILNCTKSNVKIPSLPDGELVSIETFNEDFIESIIKYSSYLTTFNYPRQSKTIRFGDIFKDRNDRHFLCITPNCDCAYPQKNNNNFYFITGSTIKNNYKTLEGQKPNIWVKKGRVDAIQSAEKGFFSFLNKKNNAIIVEWTVKPFTFNISKSNNNIDDLNLNYLSKSIKLQHVTTLKENFAQRIANEAFSYGFRVGINLPH